MNMAAMHGMGHMSTGVSGTFGIVALVVCLAVFVHILYTFWRKRSVLK